MLCKALDLVHSRLSCCKETLYHSGLGCCCLLSATSYSGMGLFPGWQLFAF